MKYTGKGIVIVCLYVDNLIITCDDIDEFHSIHRQLSIRFEMKELSELRYFLGIEIARFKDGYFICQCKYTLDLLHKYGLANCKHV